MKPLQLAEPGLQSGSKLTTKPYPSIWMFVIVDSISFGIFFLVFMLERVGQNVLFAESALQLNPQLGLINTLILITSSWLVALAVAASRRGDGNLIRRRLVMAIVVASGFGIIKFFEYSAKISAGITPVSNDFFTFYFALTGIHLVHYAIGMVALIYLAFGANSQTASDQRYTAWLESGALFWHLVDLLWIFLFAMLYLLGATS